MSNGAYRKEENCNRKRFYRFNPINAYARLPFFAFHHHLRRSHSISHSLSTEIHLPCDSFVFNGLFFRRVCVCVFLLFAQVFELYSDNKSVKSFKMFAFPFNSDSSIVHIHSPSISIGFAFAFCFRFYRSRHLRSISFHSCFQSHNRKRII